MTPWQEGFVKQCEARGINPSAVAKYAEDYSKGQKATQRLLAKRAAAAKAAFDSMTPYQQGFAIRCHQRGLLAEKVAAYAMRKSATGRISPALGWPEGEPTEVLPNGKPTGDDVAAVIGALENANYDVDKAELADELALARGNSSEPENRVDSSPSLLDRIINKYYQGKETVKDTVARGKAEAKELYGKGKEKAQKAYMQGRDYVKTPKGKAVVAGGGAALTAALLGAYLLSRKKKKKAKK